MAKRWSGRSAPAKSVAGSLCTESPRRQNAKRSRIISAVPAIRLSYRASCLRFNRWCTSNGAAASKNDAGATLPLDASIAHHTRVLLHRRNVPLLRACDAFLAAERLTFSEEGRAIYSQGRRGLTMVAAVFREGCVDHRRFQPHRRGGGRFRHGHAGVQDEIRGR